MTVCPILHRGRVLFLIGALPLNGCSGAPSFSLFGAFFPAWLLCGVVGVFCAGVARLILVRTKLSDVLPFQLAVCTAFGVIAATLTWLVWFG
jgi:hypothetical protein